MAIKKADVLLIDRIIDQYDSVKVIKTNRGKDGFLYKKRIGKLYCFVEEVWSGEKILAVKTLYKSLSGGVDALLEGSPLSTRPERYPDPGFGNNIMILEGGVKPFFRQWSYGMIFEESYLYDYVERGIESMTYTILENISDGIGADLDTSNPTHDEPTLSVSRHGSGDFSLNVNAQNNGVNGFKDLPSDDMTKFTDYIISTHKWPTRTRPDMVAEDSNPDRTINPFNDGVNDIFEDTLPFPAQVSGTWRTAINGAQSFADIEAVFRQVFQPDALEGMRNGN